MTPFHAAPGVVLGLAVVLAVAIGLLAVRLLENLAPWLGTWSYAIEADALVVRVRMPLGLRLWQRRLRLATIRSVERTAGPGPGGGTLPFRLGRKQLLGSNATAETVDLQRAGFGWRSLVVLTPPEPDRFATDLRLALMRVRAERAARPRRAWYTPPSWPLP